MRVQHNIAAMNAYRNFGVNNSKLSKNLEKLSSGYAINRGADDAAGLSISEKMRKEITILDADIKNTKNGISKVQAADGALAEVHDILNRMQYLNQSQNDPAMDNDDKQALYDESLALGKEFTRIMTTKFNGSTAIDNVSLSLDTGTIAVAEDDTAVITDVTEADENLGMDGSATYDATDMITNVSKLRSALGAAQNRMEHTLNNLQSVRENLQNAESTVRDTDIAEEMMKYTKNSIMNQAAQAMLAQANQQPQGVLQLLQ